MDGTNMFDTMTMTKIVAGFCGSLLAFLLAKWGAEELYHVGPAGHGSGEITQAYVVELAPVETGGEVEQVDFVALVMAGDVAAGERAYAKCRGCHKMDGTNSVGPYLNGVVNRDVAAVQGYNYSPAMAGMEGVWDADTLGAFIENPRRYLDGTRMNFPGIPRVQERANLVAYLATVQ